MKSPEHLQPGPIGSLLRSPTAVDLFLFSAAIGMAHRIHYDVEYTRSVESHPNLLVQGPLQATYAVQLIQEWARSQDLHIEPMRFKYRHQRPAYVDSELLVQAVLTEFDPGTGEVSITVEIMSSDIDTPATSGEFVGRVSTLAEQIVR